MTPLEALLIVQHYQFQSHQSDAAKHVLGKARRIISEAAETAMQSQVGELCTTCWGDGFHRPSLHHVRGPCQVCNGTGRRTAANNRGTSQPDTDGDKK